jgi:hypothetical protein
MKRKKAVLITFTVKTERFDSVYERNKFFRMLYGWKQIIRKELVRKPKEKVYVYRRVGLLDEIPHVKVDQSSFIIPEKEFQKVFKFLKEWHDKVMFRTFKILLEDSSILRELEEFERRIEKELEEW